MDEIQNEQNERIIDVDLENEVQKSFMAYSMSVIVQRALPDVRDGLKPVHRRILYAMYEDGITPDKPYKKCATTVGDVLGRYHPHGDASVYDALVRLAQDFSMRYMLVDGHGNFGSVDGDPPAAYRYTESRMSKLAVEMLQDIDKDTVDFGPNFDDSRKEPKVLPSHFPNLLVNGSTGIAVGMATNIPPHNLGEIIDGVCALIDNPDIDLDGLMQYIKGPDFPTAGIIMGRVGIRAAYATGKGRITVRARAEIVEEKNGRFSIVVTELPYQVNKARLIENIANLVKEKRITGISNIEDHSDRNGMHILISVKRDASPQIVLNQLYSYTQLQTTFSVNMLAIVDAHGDYSGEPKLLNLKQILEYYVDFQKDVVTRRTKFELNKALARAHILEGLKIAVDNIDEIISIIRSSKDRTSARARMTERFGLDDIQTQAIVQMPLGALTGLERKKLEEELASIQEKVADLRDILAHEERVLSIIKADAQNVKKKFSDERRTEIVAVSGEVDIEDLIPDEECVLTLTDFGYVKRLAADTYHTQNRGGRGISAMTRREEDCTSEMFVCGSHDYVLFFTNFGRVYRLKCYEVPEGSRTSKGMNIANLLPISQNENVTSMIRVPEFDDESYLCMVTRNGIIKRTVLSAYNTARKGGVIALDLADGDELCWVRLTSGNDELLVATHLGMAIRFNENDVRPMGRTARGVKAITLKESDYVIGMSILRDGGRVLTVSETGYGRLSPIENYRSKEGILIRIPANSIRICARPSKGVKVMRLGSTDKVITLARTEHEESETTDELPEDDSNPDEGTDEKAETPEDQKDE